MSIDDVECIEEGGAEPTVALLRQFAVALDADVRLLPAMTSVRSASRLTQPETAFRPLWVGQDDALADVELQLSCRQLPDIKVWLRIRSTRLRRSGCLHA